MNLRAPVALALLCFAACARPSSNTPTLTLVDAGPWTGEKADAWRRKAIADFTRESGVRVQLVYWSRDRPLDFVVRSLQGVPADVYALDVVWPGVVAPYLLDLRPHLGREVQDHFPAVVDSYVVDGKLVGMPSYTDAGLLFYRTDLLREHGFTLGIPAEALAHVFEPFYRVDHVEHRKAEGTGLGLSIVKALVQQHGGEVRVESEPGQGSTFTVLLPLAGC